MTTAAATTWARCRLCRVRLKAEDGDGAARGVCRDCAGRPEAARLPVGANGHAAPPTTGPASPSRARPFTDADRSLIRAMHGYLPAAQLLGILNDRLHADVGAGAVGYTLEQLHREVQALAGDPADGDWTALRRLLGQARHNGLLGALTPEVLADFAVVFSLSPGQATRLQDVVQGARRVTQ